MRQRAHIVPAVVILGVLLLGGPTARRAMGAAGDIPDTQVFVEFRSTSGGYALETPQGWARTGAGADVRFISALDGLRVTVTHAATAPTAASARSTVVAALTKSGRAVRITKVEDVRLPTGAAARITYTSESASNPVTGKAEPLEDTAYLFYTKGKLATLTLWAPRGVDNVDQWRRIAHSFRWL